MLIVVKIAHIHNDKMNDAHDEIGLPAVCEATPFVVPPSTHHILLTVT